MNAKYPERKIARMRSYDYHQSGAYAVTICVHKHRFAFGRIKNGEMCLHPFGRVAHDDWLAIPIHYPNVILDEFVVMPNHLHGIIFLKNEIPATVEEETELRRFGKPVSGSISAIIGNYKSGVSRKIGRLRGCKTEVWQTRFWDHIIRDEDDLLHQREYIHENPLRWDDDELNPNP